ncbi:NADH-ubiquinone oxidoreductase 75 kDa subunit, mitochondrial, partial [Armadillidium vulgare]
MLKFLFNLNLEIYKFKKKEYIHSKATGKKFSSHPENPNWIVVQNASLEDKGKYTCTAIQLSQQTSNHEIFGIEVKVHREYF